MRSEERLLRFERYTDLPLLILAMALVPLLILPEVAHIRGRAADAIVLADWFIWGVFAAEFSIKLLLAPHRAAYVRRHWLEAAMVVLPFLRPLRIARVARLVRLAATLGVNVHMLRVIADQRGTKFVAAAVLAILIAGATLAFLAERQSGEANMETFGDALWWAATTMTTVGYGDHFPVTPMGRGIAVALMLLGIAALSALTASVAAYLVQEQKSDELGDLIMEVRALRAELAANRAEPVLQQDGGSGT
jgi:voltage-gated potassium channel